MMTARRRVLITYPPSLEERDAFDETLGVLADVGYLPQIAEGERAAALASANVVLARHIGEELRPAELALLNSASLIQLVPASADDIPFGQLPADVPVAVNARAYAEPIAEHVLALALALAKRLLPNDAALARGEYDHHTPTRDICGSLAAILGFGGIGRASATLFRALGARICAIGRSAPVGELADRTGTLADLDTVLAAADILVIALPLTTATRGLIGRRELSLMKPDAILINIARAAIVDEDSLYEHLRRNPSFSAGIDVWWQEPHGTGDWKEAAGRLKYALDTIDAQRLHDYVFSLPAFAGAARLSLHHGDPIQARRQVAKAMRARPSATYLLPYIAVRLRLHLATVFLAMADLGTVHQLLREIDDILTHRPALGTLIDEVRDFRSALESTAASGPAGSLPLSPAELRLLPYLQTHLTADMIAKRLFISIHTVKTEIKSIYRKLGVSSRDDAVRKATEIGLLGGEPTSQWGPVWSSTAAKPRKSGG